MAIEEKMNSWSRKSKALSKKFRDYEENYRKKIYSKLTEDEKRKRNYRIINGKEYCDRMRQARQTYFKEEIEKLLGDLVKIQQSKNIYSTESSEPALLPARIVFEQQIHQSFSS